MPALMTADFLLQRRQMIRQQPLFLTWVKGKSKRGISEKKYQDLLE